MIGILHFTTLVIATMLAAGAAFLMDWLLLRAIFHLMRHATAWKIAGISATKSAAALSLVTGTTRVTQAYAGRR